VRLEGSFGCPPGRRQRELFVKSAVVLGPSDAMVRSAVNSRRPDRSAVSLLIRIQTYPIQQEYQPPESLRALPHLRARTPLNSALLRFRSEAIASVTRFFGSRHFAQTHPPLITSSDCEGGGEVFTVSSADHPSSTGETEAQDSFFRSPKYLTVSSQLHLEALAQAIGNVWTLSPTFRAEKSDTSRHLSEFYMLEAEVSFVDDLSRVMDLVEDLVRSVVRDLEATSVGQELLISLPNSGSDRTSSEERLRRWSGIKELNWPRVTYAEVIDILRSATEQFAHPPAWGRPLQAEHERYIAESVGQGRPVFVTHYPREIKAFYMRPTDTSAEDCSSQADVSGEARRQGPDRNDLFSQTVDCFDLLVPEICEIAGGSMREHRLGRLLQAMHSKGLPTPSTEGVRLANGNGKLELDEIQASAPVKPGNLDWYVDLRRWGCPPHGGFGLGFDRLLSYLTGVKTVHDIAAFPRWYGRCDC
jgi:asparaginyl-tRNA synthetase